MFKTFIPPQTDRMTHSFIGCSESKVILFSSDEKTATTTTTTKKMNKKALQASTKSKRSHLVHFTNKHSQHGQSTHTKAHCYVGNLLEDG